MSPDRVRRASYISRTFLHMSDLYSAQHGVWILATLHLDFATCPTREQIRDDLVLKKLTTIPRFRSVAKVTKHSAGFQEVDVNTLDWNYHISFPNDDQVVMTQDAVNAFIGKFYNSDIDMSKPLWRLFVFPKYELGGIALVFAANHAVGDGISLMGVLLAMTDDAPIDPFKSMNQQKEKSNPVEKNEFVVQKRSKPPSASMSTKFKMFFKGTWRALTGSLVSKADPENPFKLPANKFYDNYSGLRNIATSEPIELDQVKAIKNRLSGATVNDLLLAILTMTLRAYLDEHHPELMANRKFKGKNFVTAQFLVAAMGKNDPLLPKGNTRNFWTTLSFFYPIQVADKSALECFYQVKQQIDEAKVSPQVPIQMNVLKLATNVLPRTQFVPLGVDTYTRCSVMMSNVPGPQKVVHMMGAELKDLNFVSISPVGTYLGIFSYNGKISLCASFEDSRPIDAKSFVRHWGEQFQRLKTEIDAIKGPINRKLARKLLKSKKKTMAISSV